MANATPTPIQTGLFDFFALQPELRLMVCTRIENEDLCNMRLTCRQLFVEINEEFERRYLGEITILGTVSKVKQLHDILRLPIMAQSALKIRGLHVSYPVLNDLTIIGDALEDWLPSERSARRLLNAIPNLREFTLRDPDDGEEFEIRTEHEVLATNQAIAQIFFSALGSLEPKASNLTRLTLDGINFDGLDLHGVLSVHSSSLRMVELMSCELIGDQMIPVTWDLIFHKLHEMKLDELVLVGLYDPDGEDQLVLHERSFGDRKVDKWSSSNPLHRAPPVDAHGTRHNFSDYEEADVDGSCAIFSRWEAHLRGSWVKKGLEFLLGKGNHILYWDPRDSEDILGGQ